MTQYESGTGQKAFKTKIKHSLKGKKFQFILKL